MNSLGLPVSLGLSALLGICVALFAMQLDHILSSITLRYIGDRQRELQRLQLENVRLQWLLRCWVFAAVGIVSWLGIALQAWPLAALAAYLVYAAPLWCLDWWIAWRQRLLRDQMAPACICLASAVQAGMALASALQLTASRTPWPLTAELAQIVHDYYRGQPLRDAIEGVRRRLQLEQFSLFASAICVAIDRGGRLDAALARISRSVEDQQRLERKVDSETASGRMAIRVLTAAPFAMAALALSCGFLDLGALTATFPGQVAICAIGLMIYGALRWGRAIVESVA